MCSAPADSGNREPKILRKGWVFGPSVKRPVCHVEMPGFNSKLWLPILASSQCTPWEVVANGSYNVIMVVIPVPSM